MPVHDDLDPLSELADNDPVPDVIIMTMRLDLSEMGDVFDTADLEADIANIVSRDIAPVRGWIVRAPRPVELMAMSEDHMAQLGYTF